VPEISRFFGITILMYFADHGPPHFHARYAEHKAKLAIDGPVLLDGWLPPRVLGLVIEWASLRRAELAENWELARTQEPLRRVPPLE
jgi:hypothetical protein